MLSPGQFFGPRFTELPYSSRFLTLAAARVTVPQLSIQSFRARAKLVGADQVSKNSWDSEDQLKPKPTPQARFKAPPTDSELKRAERTYSPEEWHTLEVEAAERNLDRHLETDIRGVPTDFDELMDLTLETDFADVGSVVTGMTGLPSRSRSKLNIPTDRERNSSCPAWVAPKKAYSTNRGPHLPSAETSASAKSSAPAKSSDSSRGVGNDFFHI